MSLVTCIWLPFVLLASNTFASSLLLIYLCVLVSLPLMIHSFAYFSVCFFPLLSFAFAVSPFLSLLLPLFPSQPLLYISQCLSVSLLLSTHSERWLYWFFLWWYCPRTTMGQKTFLTYLSVCVYSVCLVSVYACVYVQPEASLTFRSHH